MYDGSVQQEHTPYGYAALGGNKKAASALLRSASAAEGLNYISA
jgi:hypothetical protein